MTARPYLYLDTTAGMAVTVQCGSYRQRARISREQHSSRILLPLISRCLKRAGKPYSAIRGVAVVSGPGAFTALRVGIATANTLGVAFDIPVVGIPKTPAMNFDQFVKAANKTLAHTRRFTPVVPVYGRPPHITRRRSRP